MPYHRSGAERYNLERSYQILAKLTGHAVTREQHETGMTYTIRPLRPAGSPPCLIAANPTSVVLWLVKHVRDLAAQAAKGGA